MNQYLKSAANRFNQLNKDGKVHLISPISQIDGEIITEIIELFRKFHADNIVEVLNNYKFRKDEEVRDDLLSLNTEFNMGKGNQDLPNTPEDVSEKVAELIKKRDYVKIQDERVYVWSITSWGKEERYCPHKKDMIYSIVLNRVEKTLQVSKVPMYSNHRFDYEDIDERDLAFDNLDSALLSSGLVNIWEV